MTGVAGVKGENGGARLFCGRFVNQEDVSHDRGGRFGLITDDAIHFLTY